MSIAKQQQTKNNYQIFSFFVVVMGFSEALVASVYLSRLNYLNDIVWALPICLVFALIGCFCLEEYGMRKPKCH